MAPKHHPPSLSGGDRKALAKEHGRARAMTSILAAQSADARAKGEALIRTAHKLLAEKLEGTFLGQWRSNRSISYDRPDH